MDILASQKLADELLAFAVEQDMGHVAIRAIVEIQRQLHKPNPDTDGISVAVNMAFAEFYGALMKLERSQ